jgi:hypothetical protein
MITMLTFVGKSYAEMSYGVSLAYTQINADGTETEGGESNTGKRRSQRDHPFIVC